MNTDEIISRYYPVAEAHALLPEIRIHKATDNETVPNLAKQGLLPTQWGLEHTYGHVYPGGAHLSRYILDHPEEVRGKNVIDIFSGSGVVAIAAKMAGAASVTAVDRDGIATEFIRRNAALNKMPITILQRDASNGIAFGDANVITAADAFLKDQSVELQSWLYAVASCGVAVFAASGQYSAPMLAQFGQPLRPTEQSQAAFGTPPIFVKLQR